MSAGDDEIRFAEIASRAAAARATGSPVEVGNYRFCDEIARIAVAGGSLGRAVLPSLVHLRCAVAEDAPPSLHVDLWDVAECGVRGLSAGESLARGRRWDLVDGCVAISADGRFLSHRSKNSVAWLDRRDGCIAGWVEDAAALTLHQRGKPLQMLLAVRASDRGLTAVHAAGVVHPNGAGMLLPANSGAGKSTTALACVRGGYACLGDDWAGLSRLGDGTWIGYGLYSSLFFEREQALRFGDFIADRLESPAPGEEKHLFLAGEHLPGSFAVAARLRAVAIPRFRPGRTATLRPASPAEVLLSLVPSTVFAMRPRLDPDGIDRLARLVDELPGYVLETGTDLDSIPRCLDEILGEK